MDRVVLTLQIEKEQELQQALAIKQQHNQDKALVVETTPLLTHLLLVRPKQLDLPIRDLETKGL